MEINGLVGETAGEVWHLLKGGGPQTLDQLKGQLKGTREFLNVAVGWLAREDKIEISPEKQSFRVRLK